MKKKLLKNWIIPVASLFMLGLIFFYLVGLRTFSIKEPVYFYIAGTKTPFAGDSQLRKEKDQVVFKNKAIKNEKNGMDTNGRPLFFEGQKKMLLTSAMEVVIPKQNKIAKLDTYTEIKGEGKNIYALLNNEKKPLDQGFLFDGQDTYVFLEQATIEVGEKTFDLPPFSMIVALEGHGVEIYPSDVESYTVDLLYSEALWVRVSDNSHPYSINLTNKRLYDQSGEKMLFTNPQTLPLLGEVKE